MKQKVSEIFYSLQGEGYWTGTPVVFVRFQGCNLNCPWCDTKYSFSPSCALTLTDHEIVQEVINLSPSTCKRVVLTGGEPLYNRDLSFLVRLFHKNGIQVHMESNGSIYTDVVEDIDYLTVSPKEGGELNTLTLIKAKELKFIVDSPESLMWIQSFENLGLKCKLYVQPEGTKPEMTQLAIEFVKQNPQWRLSLQTHKLLDIR